VITASRKPGGYGSYGRGTAGEGSDLDLLLILKHCDEPIWERLRRWDTSSLPLACDLLVYSLPEWRTLPQWPQVGGGAASGDALAGGGFRSVAGAVHAALIGPSHR
jgi:hypothetical protein